MSKVALSCVFALVLGGVGLAGIQTFTRDDDSASDAAQLTELGRIRDDLSAVQSSLRKLGDQLARLEAAQVEYASLRVEPASVSVAAEEATEEQPGANAGGRSRSELQSILLAALQEDRRLREEAQEEQREEMRARMEERREEMEQMREGPYDTYNLKVNSMAGLLSLTESQKESYFAITKKYNEAFQEQREQLRDKAQAAREAGQEAGGAEGQDQGGPRGRRGRGGFEQFQQYRELATNLQKQYVTEMANVLSVGQLETFTALPESSQSFTNLGMTSTAESRGRGGMFGGFSRGAGGRGGRGGGR